MAGLTPMNLASLSSRRASSLRNFAVLAVSLRECTKISTWCLPAHASTCRECPQDQYQIRPSR